MSAKEADDLGRFFWGIDLQTGEPYLDALRRRLALAARASLSEVRAGNFDAADARVLAVDRGIQSAVMLGAMYTAELEQAVDAGKRESDPAYITALHARALRWRQSAYPEPHTAPEAEYFSAGRDEDRAELDALLEKSR